MKLLLAGSLHVVQYGEGLEWGHQIGSFPMEFNLIISGGQCTLTLTTFSNPYCNMRLIGYVHV